MLRSLCVTMLVIAGWAPTALAQNFGMPPGERYFRLEWAPAEAGRPAIQGRVTNIGGFTAGEIQVQVEELSPAGQVTRTTSTVIHGQLGPGSRVAFEVPVAASPAYRVHIQSFDRLEGVGSGAQR